MRKAVRYILISTISVLFILSCSPIKSSPEEERHKVELTLHEVQTNLDDSRHDLNCFRSELQILDNKIKHLENSIISFKQNHLEKLHSRYDYLCNQIASIEKKFMQNEKQQLSAKQDLRILSQHANETRDALVQYKGRLGEIEKEIKNQNNKLVEVIKLRKTIETIAQAGSIENMAKTYKVKSGDSLEKIAKNNNVSVEAIKKANHLEQDLIVIGQELKIPNAN